MPKENILADKSLDFAVRIVKFYTHLKDVKQEYIMSKQVMRSGTSIGANVAEACGAQTEPDFITKIHIALKEALETIYWLKLLKCTDYINETEYSSLASDVEELKAIMTSTLKSIKQRVTP